MSENPECRRNEQLDADYYQQQFDIAISAGKVVAQGSLLSAQMAKEMVDASGQWLMPGLLDIHTHLDLEVEVDSRLTECVRHGTTTVLVGNCSLGTCFGTQQTEAGQNPIIENRIEAFKYFSLTSGRLWGKTLKTSALTALEFALMPKGSNAFLGFAKLMNSKFFQGDLHFQAGDASDYGG